MQCRISPTLPPPQNAYRGPLMVICKKTYVMLHLEAEWPSKQNILIAETILAEQARSQVLRFGVAKYIFRGDRFLFLSYV